MLTLSGVEVDVFLDILSSSRGESQTTRLSHLVGGGIQDLSDAGLRGSLWLTGRVARFSARGGLEVRGGCWRVGLWG